MWKCHPVVIKPLQLQHKLICLAAARFAIASSISSMSSSGDFEGSSFFLDMPHLKRKLIGDGIQCTPRKDWKKLGWLGRWMSRFQSWNPNNPAAVPGERLTWRRDVVRTGAGPSDFSCFCCILGPLWGRTHYRMYRFILGPLWSASLDTQRLSQSNIIIYESHFGESFLHIYEFELVTNVELRMAWVPGFIVDDSL